MLAEEATSIEDLDRAALESELKGLEEDLGFSREDAVKTAHINRRIAITQAKIAAVA